MDFDALFAQVLEVLQREHRISYRALRRRFDLSDDDLEDLKIEMIEAKQLAIDENDRILVWAGETESTAPPTPTPPKPEPTSPSTPEREPLSYTPPHLAEKILRSKAALEGERKQVTVLFCDLENSTAIAEKIGPEHMHTLLNRFFERALEEVHRYEGTINQFLGDGFMALYGAPLSLEDHARRGVLAALALQRTLKEAELGKPYGVACKFRMGLNSGLVVVGSIGDNLRMDYSAIGDTTNLASRLQGLADPGEILVSESTGRLVETEVRLEALLPVQVKGKSETVPVYKVIGTLPRRSPIASRSERTLSRFVGREREVAVLDELFEQVKAGQGQVVGIVAEAGQGKSRFLYEFRQRLENEPVTYLEGRCLSYGRSIPYHPVLDLVRAHCGISEADSPDAMTQKIRLRLQEVGMDAEASSPYLLQLLGVKEGTEPISVLTPEAIRTRTFDTLKQMSLKGAQQRPLIVEIEDLHWIDKTSEDYLASLVEDLAGASIILLTTYRPGYRPPWIEKSYATQISLRRLLPQDAVTVVHSASQQREIPANLEQMIIEKAEGNCFFLEELTRAVIEQGDLHADITVPDTVQGVLMARIDRLPEEPKRLLQTASILGREFSPAVLEMIWQGTASLDALLVELKRLEFLYERSGPGEPVYVFKHALTQDVAYESLLTTRRQYLHVAAGQALEALYADRLEDACDRLAYHYARTEEAAKAVEYLSRLAEQAMRGHAHAEASTIFQEALSHAEQLPESERNRCVLELAIRQADALFHLGHRQELIQQLLSQQERLRQLQSPLLAGRYHRQLSQAYSFLGNREQAAQHIEDALSYAQQSGDAATIGSAYTWLAQESGFRGEYLQGIAYGQRAVSLFNQIEDREGLGFAYAVLGYLYMTHGDFVNLLDVATRLASIGGTIGNRRLQTIAIFFNGSAYEALGEWEMAIDAFQQAITYSPSPFETALVLGYLGSALLGKSDLAEAIATLEKAVQQANQYRSRQVQSWFKSLLGEAYLANGQIEEAQDFAHQGLALAKSIKYPAGIGLAQRTLGCIAQTRGNLAEAESHLHAAMETYAAIQARYQLARTHLDLASLARAQGHQATAATHLSTARAWFKKLQVPKYVERTEQLAREYDVTLVEIDPEALTEGGA